MTIAVAHGGDGTTFGVAVVKLIVPTENIPAILAATGNGVARPTAQVDAEMVTLQSGGQR
jgi:hypothetical protein